MARESGFTLIELVVVITITGIIAGIVAIFIGGPIRGMMDATRRAQLSDTADTALRRMGRDLRMALPNSVRVTQVGSAYYLEYLEVTSGGRYRSQSSGAPTSPACPADDPAITDNDVLETGFSDTCFKTLGDIPDFGKVVAGNYVVVYNLGQGITNSDAYQSGAATGGDKSRITAVSASGSEDRIVFESNDFELASPGARFQIVSGPVTYRCDPASGTLTRFWGYPIQQNQPVSTSAPPLSAASSALLATNVSGCSFAYSPGVTERSGLLSMFLQLSREGENVNLYHEVHVDNVP
ncbi:MAG TPA: prepilin-type N-terminal cleavage/methylation domain-containing protein [Burkholderiales bacterium]|nr:prepilin-type N-terminal cleavage/methylation domain-containing protein [Burkholderiales bacterium]